MRRLKHSQVGDTIIEVMLAIAIVGMVLGASYSTATRALRTGRFAQEQTEALKLAESQIEKIKYIAGLDISKTPPDLFDTSTPDKKIFCIDDSVPFNKVLTTVDTPAASCKNISGLYTVRIEYGGPPEDTFLVTVNWERQATSQLGVVQVAYKLHK